jgi:DNA-binding XRE family transcriptional regulator
MKNTPILLPNNIKILKALGEQIQLARLRRKFSAAQIAERTGMGRKTVYNIEQGSPSVAMQDAGIVTGKRAPKQTKI